MAHICHENGQPQSVHPITDGELMIGRGDECALQVTDLCVSRQHASISRVGDLYYIRDLGSRRGTFVNQRRVESAQLAHGDEVTVGFCVLRVVLDESPPLGSANGSPADGPARTLETGSTTIVSTIDVSAQDGSRTGVRSEAKLNAVLDIMKSLHLALCVDELLPRILDSLFRIFPLAEHALVLLRDERTGEYVSRASRCRSGAGPTAAPVSQTIVRKVVGARQAILSKDVLTDERFDRQQSIMGLGIHSMLCAPLLDLAGESLGLLQVHSEHERGSFTSDDLEVLVSIASTIAMALSNAQYSEQRAEQERILRESELAMDLQQRLLPARAPEVHGYDFYHFYEPARQVGGDYYGYVRLDDGRVAVAVGDVSGKGLAAAMLMARLSSAVRYSVLETRDPARALQSVNRSLAEVEMDDTFVTLTLMILDPQHHTVRFANAGHLPPLHHRADGNVEALGADAAGMPLNVSLDPDYEYENVELVLRPGETLLLVTDGITEARNQFGDMLGVQRTSRELQKRPGDPTGAGRGVVEGAISFALGAAQHDDMTLVSFGRLAGDR